jgi:hypothetical protein
MPVSKYHFDTSIGKRDKNLVVTFYDSSNKETGKTKVWTDGDITFPDNYNNQRNLPGLTINLQYPELRTGDSPITTYDGLFGSLSNSAISMLPAFNQYSGDTKKTAIALYGGSVMTWADIVGKAVPYKPRWEGHNYYLGKTKDQTVLDSYEYCGTADMEVQSWEKNLTYMQDLRVIRQYREATLSDAYGIYQLTSAMNSTAKTCEQLFSMCGYLNSDWYEKYKKSERPEAAGGVVSWINFDATSNFVSGGSSKSYQITKNTSVNGSTYNGSFKTLSGTGCSERLFYNQMIAAGKVKGLSIIYSSDFDKYDKRRNSPSTCWDRMKNFTFDYQSYLNSIAKVTFEAWKATYYDFKAPGTYRLDVDMKSTNVRSIQILNPFNGVSVK